MNADQETTTSGYSWNGEEGVLSTLSPEMIGKEGEAVGTLIIIIVAAVITIVLLFVIAIFIDYRQQKIIDAKTTHIKKMFKIKLPTMARKPLDDRVSFADKMYPSEPSSPCDMA